MQFIDLKAQYAELKQEIDMGISRVLEHGQFIMGPEVKELEEKLASYTGIKHCITCANGTDALQLAYMAYGIGQGDAVFCPDITFIASVEPAYLLGATPVFCDITKDTYNICPESLERQIKAVLGEGKLTPKAVVAVDFLGNPADYKKISDICEKYDLVLIEDAAQSFGAEYDGKKCCSFGDIATTSFFPAKPLGCYGDGGAVFTDNDEIAEICKSIRVHGKGPQGKYNNIRIGTNSRLDTIQAAVLIAKLDAMNDEISKRQKIAGRYNEIFKDFFVTPFVEEKNISVYAQYALLAETQQKRDAVIEALTQKGIPNMIYYPFPQHVLPVFSNLSQYAEAFDNANDYCNRTFSLPMSPYLSEADQELVIKAVLEAAK